MKAVKTAAFALTAIVCVSLCGCACVWNGLENEAIIGKWSVASIEYEGVTYTGEEIAAGFGYIPSYTLKPNGELICAGAQGELAGTWRLDGVKITITIGDQTAQGNIIAPNKFVIGVDRQIPVTFVKE